MGFLTDDCICLLKAEFSETSQILTLFSAAHGVVKVMAKGAHRRTKAGASKFDGGIDLLDRGEAMFTDRTDKDLAILTEWKLLDGHLALRKNLRGMYLGMYAAELVAMFFEQHDPHPEMFGLLSHCLNELGSNR